MGEKINKEFDKFQQDLEIREKKLKDLVQFIPDDKIDLVLDEIKEKKINL